MSGIYFLKGSYTDEGYLIYTYDNAGNIATISENGVLKAAYTYDQFGQLVREDNAWADRTYLYHYDNGGNLTMVQECYYRTGTMHQTDLIQNISYTYGDATTDGTPAWKDLLTSYNGNTITYDAIGNPLNWGTSITNMTRNNGRRLTSLKNGASVIQYGYDESGLRTRKYTGTYTVFDRDASGNLVHETRNNGTNHLYYYYDANGSISSISYNGIRYAFRKNLQGDVIAILDTNSNVVARYTYDAWGKILSITDASGNAITSSTHIANINPIRYRGYYYDTETGWYYLNSRYYDPQVKRFINADGVVDNRGINTQNLFAYCGNNPIAKVDSSGTAWTLNGVTYNYDGSIADFHRAEQGLSPLAYEIAVQQEKAAYAATVYAESAAYSIESKEAVAHVINNRVGTPTVNGKGTRNTIMDVVSEPAQFSSYENVWYNEALTYYTTGMVENEYDRRVLKECMEVVIPIYEGEATDITEGCTYFYSPISMDPSGSQPSWVSGKTEVVINSVNPKYFRFYK